MTTQREQLRACASHATGRLSRTTEGMFGRVAEYEGLFRGNRLNSDIDPRDEHIRTQIAKQ